MSWFNKTVLPSSKLKLEDVIPKYDAYMQSVMRVGKCIYQGFLPDKYLNDQLSYLKGFHEYKVYTPRNKEGKTRRRKTLNVAKFSTEYITKLIYTEAVTFNTISSNEAARDNIDEYLKETLEKNNYWSNTSGNCEVMFNVGGAIEKPIIKNGEIRIEYSDGTHFVATDYDMAEIYSGAFVSTFTKEGYYFTKITKYTQKGKDYVVSKELYKSSDPTYVGTKVNYKLYFDDKQQFTLKNFKSIPFTYKKPRIKNNLVLNSPYGIPIWWSAIDVMADIDMIFDRKYSEEKYGGRQKVIPSYAMKKTYNKNTLASETFYDPDDETLLGLDLDPENAQTKPIDLTSEIRYEPFIQLMNQSLDLYSMKIGVSFGSFTSDGKTIQTATQVITEKESTYQTKVNQEKALQKQHKNLFMSIVELANAAELDDRVRIIPDDLDFEIVFDDSVILDKDAELNAYVRDVDAGRVEEWRLIQKQYNLSEEDAKQWVQDAYFSISFMLL